MNAYIVRGEAGDFQIVTGSRGSTPVIWGLDTREEAFRIFLLYAPIYGWELAE